MTINLYNAPQQNLQQIVDRCNKEADGAYDIKLHTLPRGADGQREQMVRRLAAEDSGMDVLGLDVTWTAELASAKWIRPWPKDKAAEATEGVLEGPLQTAMYEDELYAAPYNSNVQLLWYRSDLVPEAPTTWSELIDVAEKLKSEDKPHYFEVTGAQYEGLVVWFNSMVESAGGKLLNEDGDKVELGPEAVKALETMRDFAKSAAANPSLPNTQEDPARLAVESGASFGEANWPFVYPAMQGSGAKFAKDFKWAPYPGIDGPGKSPLGGANFAVSSYSEHPDEAFDATLCLRDPQSQLTAAVKDGLPPTIESVYDSTDTVEVTDPEGKTSQVGMADAYPMRDAIKDAIKNAAVRPVTPVYQNVSTVTSKILSPPGSIDPETTEQRLREQIADALESKGVLP
ncbi:extracellular solute-binding protein family 1 [Stackebrandtia nassauensis DSM 44728]|uniref:Extracellular solute-binding protein family 1 n=1 Tax=Stackebrandtia nassauensis (strain DSM 44728 / CIP 108903 / NRRL B-16338 / NBRC 102104 / LLR-40K-21) TaxID=446470 RepID=D3Q6P4_STANL|nr:ABC transporter substrate-binding protein [Stackebrandtia nassauensis]ADD44287.1 extracellular solute-binding protein family 1 [Stackebrandtia nassauensis DSM 44728]